MAVEMTSIQEVVDSMCLLAAEPCSLPASSQQVIDDYRRTQCKWFCQVRMCVNSWCGLVMSLVTSLCVSVCLFSSCSDF